MVFIVTFIALLIERFFDWGHLRNWFWFGKAQSEFIKYGKSLSPYLLLFLSIVPFLLVVLLIQMLVNNWLYGFVELVFQLLVLLYCLGPQNLWADTFACINSLTNNDVSPTFDKLKTRFELVETSYTKSLHWYFLNYIFIEANSRIFAVIFWFVLLGPVGAVLYRCITLSSPYGFKQENEAFAQATLRAEAVLNWLPIKIFTFIFAIVGHFMQVLTCWRKNLSFSLNNNEKLLTECGISALGFEDQTHIPEDGSAEKNAISLLDRALIVTLIIIGCIALI